MARIEGSGSRNILDMHSTSATGRAELRFASNDVTKWDLGVDGSDNDKFRIAPNHNWDNTNNGITINLDGDLGIGTTTPQNKLNVIGDGNFTGTIYQNEFQVLDTRYSHLSNFTDDILWTL